jgi:hypothetical protein
MILCMTCTKIFYIGTAMSLSARRYIAKGSGDEMKLVDSTKKRKKCGNTPEKKLVRNFQKQIYLYIMYIEVDT